MENSGSTVVYSSIMTHIKSAWEKLNVKKFAEELGGSSTEAVQASIYFGTSFAIGFLFKKYFKFLFFVLFVSVTLILFLEYNSILDIDWAALNVFLGFEPNADVGTLIDFTFTWIKQNFIIFVSTLVGFLLGYKLG